MSIVSRHTYTEIIGTDENRVKNEVTQYHLLGISLLTTRKEVWRKGSEIEPDMRRIVRLMDGDRCVYCNARYEKKARFAIDHIIPQIQGGPTHIFNLTLACAQCNGAKSGRTPDEAGMPLLYGRFRVDHVDGMRMAAGFVKSSVRTIPICYEEYRYYESICDVIAAIDVMGETERWRAWCNFVKDFGYGEPFNTEFITCKGKIPFLY
jgi:5-methylcytosine-specific restriction endonuclease McrA